jgi:hypothetical protein
MNPGFRWIEPGKRPGLFWRIFLRTFGVGVLVFALVDVGLSMFRSHGDPTFYPALGIALLAGLAAMLFDRRRIAIDATGVRVAGMMGLLPARNIPFSRIGSVRCIAWARSFAIPKPYDAEGRIVGRAVLPAQPVLHLYGPGVSQGGGREILAAAFGNGIDPIRVLEYFTAAGIDAAVAQPNARARRNQGLASALVFAVLSAILAFGLIDRLNDAKSDGAATPEIQCVTAALDGSFDVRVNHLDTLEDIVFTRGGIDVADVPGRTIAVDRSPLGFFVSAADLRFNDVHLDRKQTYELRVETSDAADSIDIDPARSDPQGTGC